MALIEYHPPLDPFLDEVYRDNYILVINKPSGLLSVPGNRPEYFENVSRKSTILRCYGENWARK